MKLKFISLASGSSGNSFYLGTTSYGILIDAGIGIRTIKKVLRERGIALESILGIFVTHDREEAQLVADRIITMERGRVVAES